MRTPGMFKSLHGTPFWGQVGEAPKGGGVIRLPIGIIMQGIFYNPRTVAEKGEEGFAYTHENASQLVQGIIGGTKVIRLRETNFR